MSSGLGAGMGADMLQQILQQKFQEQAAMRELANRERETAQRGAASQRDFQLRERGLDQDAQQMEAMAGAAQAKQAQEAAAQQQMITQAQLRAAIQGSQNMAGTDDPTGSLGTRNALRVALTAGGAKGNEIPQEPEAPKAPSLPSAAQEYEYAKAQGFKGTFEQYQNADANRKRPVVNVTAQTAQSNSNAMKLADDYTRDAKEFTTMNSAMRKIVASAKDPSAAGDMALLYGYMKLLDPGSVVRETEFATAAQSGSLPQQIQGAASKVISGQRLTPEQRADFVKRAAALYGEAKASNTTVRDSYTQRAKKFGVDPSMVFTDIGEPELPNAGTGGPIRYDMNGKPIK